MQKRIEYRPVRQVPHLHSGVYCVGLGPWEYCYEKHCGSYPLAKRCRPARMVNARWNERAGHKHATPRSWSIHLRSSSVPIVPSIPRPRSHETPSRETTVVVAAVVPYLLPILKLFSWGCGQGKNSIWQKGFQAAYIWPPEKPFIIIKSSKNIVRVARKLDNVFPTRPEDIGTGLRRLKSHDQLVSGEERAAKRKAWRPVRRIYHQEQPAWGHVN